MEDFLIASFFTLLLGSIIVLPIVASIKMKKALRDAAAQMKAKRTEVPGDLEMFDVEAYEGIFKGYRTRFAKGWRVYAAGGKLVPLQGIYIEVFFAKPLSFPIEIARKGAPIFPVARIGDAEFDKKCVIASESQADVNMLLSDASIRKLIQTFLQNQKGLARITSDAVTTRFINAWKGAPLLLNTIFECARIAHAISKRLG